MQSKEFAIPVENGNSIVVTNFFSKTVVKHCLVISSATGVLQKYYYNLAEYYASKGVTVYTFDYNGIGKSNSAVAELKNNSDNLKSWAKNQGAVLEYVKHEHSDSILTLMTHSLGGQLLGLNPNYQFVNQVIMVASQSGYWKYFKGFHRLKMWLFWYVFIPGFTPLFKYFPAKKLGLFENLPKNVVYEWASWGRQRNYLMHFKNEKDYFFDKIKIPILIWSFPGDTFAPKKTVDWLADQYENAKVTRVHYNKNHEKQPGHFGFFKPAFKDFLWKQNLNWIFTNSLDE